MATREGKVARVPELKTRHASGPIRLKVDEIIYDYRGKPVTDGTGDDESEQTILDVCLTALNASRQNEEIPSDKKLKLFKLSVKLATQADGDGCVSLRDKESVLIKERVGIFYNALVYGRVCSALDGDDDDDFASNNGSGEEHPDE